MWEILPDWNNGDTTWALHSQNDHEVKSIKGTRKQISTKKKGGGAGKEKEKKF